MVAIPAAASALGKAAGGASGKVDRLGASARNAAQPLQDLLDSIFPEEVERRKLEADLDGLKSALDRGKINGERSYDAVLRLWQNYLNAPPILDKPMVGLTTDEQSLADLNKSSHDRLPESRSTLEDRKSTTL